MKIITKTRIGFFSLLLTLALSACTALPAPVATPPSPPPVVENPSQERMVTGTSICLPHKDTSGPVTMECAFGIKTAEGNYAVDLNAVTGEGFPTFEVGRQMTLTGTIVPIELLSSNHWQIYDVKGIIRVTAIK